MDVAHVERFSHDNEFNFLALIIQQPENFESAQVTVRPYMLSSGLHRNIYEAMLGVVREENEPIVTAEAVLRRLSATNKLDFSGGESYITRLKEFQINASFELYRKAVIDAYRASQVIRIGEQIPGWLGSFSNTEDLLNKVREEVDNIEGKVSTNGVVSAAEAAEQAYKVVDERFRQDDKKQPGLATGLPLLDYHTGGMFGGESWIVMSRPGHGKSATMSQMGLAVAKEGHGVLFFQKEMSLQNVIERMFAHLAEIDHTDIKFGNLAGKINDLKRAKKTLSELPMWFDTNITGDIYYAAGIIRKYKRQFPQLAVVVIDYIQLLAERSDDQTAELGRISRMLKLLAVDLDITMLIASQLNRKVEDREDKRPILSDIRQSGNIEEDADVVLGLYRPDQYELLPDSEKVRPPLEMHILKQRNGPTARLQFRVDSSTFCIIDNTNPESIDFKKVDYKNG